MQLDESVNLQIARVEILPLIDVVFLLLVFFIVMFINMTVQRGLPVALPEVSDPEIVSQASLQITVTDVGLITVEGIQVELDQLISHIKRIPDNAKRPLIIQGDKQAELGIALQILEKLTQSGFSNIAFAAMRRERTDDLTQ